MTELYKKYRPASLEDMVGQSDLVDSLTSLIKSEKIPHAILFSGPSGCGKTTAARILQTVLACGDRDWSEINCSDFRGIDMVRDIRRNCVMRPLEGKVRMYLIDECHKLSNDAQNAMLKLLEDPPRHVYFILATTDSQKLIKTIRTRCTEYRVKPLDTASARRLLVRVAKQEGLATTRDVIDEIIACSEGSARKALVLLEQVAGVEGEEAQLAALSVTSEMKEEAFKLAQKLAYPGTKWMEVAAILKGLEDDPEGVRRLILAYASKVCLGGGKLAPRAFIVLDVFSDHFYDTGKPGLVRACWECVHA